MSSREVRYHQGTNCGVMETIERPRQFIEDRHRTGPAYSQLSFEGANVEGGSWANSYLGAGTATTAIIGSGTERHTFVPQVGEDCEIVACELVFMVKASGGLTGRLADDDMNVSATATITCDGDRFPLELEVSPKLAADQAETTVEVEGHNDDGTVRVNWTWKKVHGSTGAVHLPSVRVEKAKDCACSRVILECTTDVSLTNFNNDNTMDKSTVTVDITNEIEIISVDIECACEEEHIGMMSEDKPHVSTETASRHEEVREVADVLERRLAEATEYRGELESQLPPIKVALETADSLLKIAKTPDMAEDALGFYGKTCGGSAQDIIREYTLVDMEAIRLKRRLTFVEQLVATAENGGSIDDHEADIAIDLS